MDIAIAGAGPSGLFLAVGLARRGHHVTVVDRDGGPESELSWLRGGVMQFEYAHAFRGQIVDALHREAPDVLERWLSMGAVPVRLPPVDPPPAFSGGESPDAAADAPVVGVWSQRSTFERALRHVAENQSGVRIERGRVRGVRRRNRTATGLNVDGVELSADLVIDASGRRGSVTADLADRETFGGTCGIAYVDRKYLLRPGAEPGPLTSPLVFSGRYDGYQVIVFPHEHGVFSAVVIRPAADTSLKLLRHDAAYDAAARAIPGLSEWTDPDRAEPITPVLPGGTLVNHYRSQRRTDGQPVLGNLLWAGDAVATTTPTFGRGITLAFTQCLALLAAVDRHGRDLDATGDDVHAWCESTIRPWVQDHVEVDTAQAARWDGEPIDLTSRLPSDLVLEAGAVDVTILARSMPYLTMTGGPETLDELRPIAHDIYASGWRPEADPGPTRSELRDIVTSAA